MKKQLTKTRILAYLLLLTAVSLGILSVSYARYKAQTGGEGTVKVAAWGADTTVDQVPIDISGLVPGETKTFSFQVTNTKNGNVSQVAQNYSVALETTGNLPLTFALAPTGTAPTGSTFVTDFNSSKPAVADGGFLPHTTQTIHQYTLTVTWQRNQTNAEYAEEIDLVTLVVSAEQVLPGSK